MHALPVTEAEFAALMAPLGPFGMDCPEAPLVVAVSGGADSMALAFLTARWRRHVQAVVVDHGLRANSADEARLTCQRLEAQGIAARSVRLGALPSGCVQERAREARFAVLEDACIAVGSTMLLVAHHQADQEETVWMRHERGSGMTGLGGMASKTLRGRIAVLRPLLSIRPERLRATLRTAGQVWCEDPSNRNRRFRRVQVRQDLSAGERRAMRYLARTAQERQVILEAALAARLAQAVLWQEEGWVVLLPQAFEPSPFEGGDDLADILLAVLVRAIGGRSHMPQREQVRALRQRGHGSLAGTCLVPKGEKGWHLLREGRGWEGPVPARSGQRWDGRWRYCGPTLDGAEIAALGVAAVGLRRGRGVPALAMQGLPAVWREGRVYAIPEGMRRLCDSVPRVSFVWDGGVPATGGRCVA